MELGSLEIVNAEDQSKTGQARKMIKSAILSKELAPGEGVTERGLSVKFNIGRTPIRDALKQLAFEGWFVTLPNGGLVVADYNYEDIEENFAVRAQLDAFAAAECAKHATPEIILKLNYYISASKIAIDQANWMQNAELEACFHKCIVECSGNHYLVKLYELVAGHMPKSYYLQMKNDAFIRTSLEEHKAIVEAIAAHDEIRAAECCINHMARCIKSVKEIAQNAEKVTT